MSWMTREPERFRSPRLFLAALAFLVAAASPPSSPLADSATQERLDRTYAGFPPAFTDPALADYRARYLAERPAYDANAEAFLGVDAPARPCALGEAAQRELVAGNYRATVLDRSPDAIRVRDKMGHHEREPVLDRIAFKLIEGDCSGGVLNGPATIHLSYIRAAFIEGLSWYAVAEVQSREVCDFVQSVRHGACARYDLTRRWTGMLTDDGSLIPWQQYLHEMAPDAVEAPDSFMTEDYTTFDYGRFADGIEAGPGVAFETLPVVGDGVDAMMNQTLSRSAMADGRVEYVQYHGGTPALRYILRDGRAHGELHYLQPQPGVDPVLCFEHGKQVLSASCGAM
jgi:hypothetical protein